jgi:butyryl-CoA dehydrogenase
MQFELSEEQQMMKKIVREFAEKDMAPGVAERDQQEKFDRKLYDGMAAIGLPGICFPEKYGGAGETNLSYIIAVEEISRIDGSMGVTLSASVSLCAWPIYAFGTEEQKLKYLTPLAQGVKIGAFGLTEANAGTDASSQKTTAVRDGDNYILNGTKLFITNAGEAEIYVVFAITDKSKGSKGISAFIIEKDMPGFSFGKKEHKMGIRSSQTMELVFRDVKVPADNMLGKEGEGFKIAMNTLNGGRIGIAAQALGIAQSALEQAVKYSKQRVQFGRTIAKNQAIAFMLADMATRLEAARLLTYQAAYRKDKGLNYSKESAMAKVFASDAAMAITTDAVQIFGGYGYSQEYPVEHMMRDAKITQIYEGTNQAQRIVISSEILR